MAYKIFGIPIGVIIVALVLIFYTTPQQKSSLIDAAKQICGLQDTITVQLTDSFIASIDEKETREQLQKLKDIGQVSINAAENAQLVEDLYKKKKIRLDPKCIIIGAI
jgi:hypothetical protein